LIEKAANSVLNSGIGGFITKKLSYITQIWRSNWT